MQDLLPIVASVLGVFLVMGVGAFCRHLEWLTPEADRSLANLTANVLLPAYFLEKILASPQFESLGTAWAPPVFGFAGTAIGFLLALGFARTIGPMIGLKNDASQRAFALCVGVCNYGFIPLPLAERFYPNAVIDLILHNVGVNLALWSIGIAIISGSARSGWKKAFLSAPFLSVVVAVAVRQASLGSYIPASILTAIEALGGCAIPMGLLLSGAIIVDFLRDSKWLGSPGVMLSAILLRQAVFPVLMLLATVGSNLLSLSLSWSALESPDIRARR
jgi:predicted permease